MAKRTDREACEISVAAMSAKQVVIALSADLQSKAEMIIQSLSEGKTVEDVPPVLGSLFRSSVQPYLILYLMLRRRG